MVAVQKAHVKPIARLIPKIKLVIRWQANMEGFQGQAGVHQLMSAKQNVSQTLKIQSAKSIPVNFKDREVAIQWNHANLTVNKIPLTLIVSSLLASLDFPDLEVVHPENLAKVIAGKIPRAQNVLHMLDNTAEMDLLEIKDSNKINNNNAKNP